MLSISDMLFIDFFIIPIVLFIFACVKNIVINNIVFAVHKKVKKIEVDSKLGLTITACFADFLAFLILCLIFIFDSSDFIDLYMSAVIAPMNYRLIAVFVSTVFVFCCDYFFLLPFMQVSKKHKLLLALLFTVLNAPYFALICTINVAECLNLT